MSATKPVTHRAEVLSRCSDLHLSRQEAPVPIAPHSPSREVLALCNPAMTTSALKTGCAQVRDKEEGAQPPQC